MMPRKVANSGTVTSWLRIVVSAVPRPMPKSATPIGRPIASTDPNATIRMMIANARPIVSDDGFSKSAKMNPPNSVRRPSISGRFFSTSSRISVARVNSMSSSSSTLA